MISFLAPFALTLLYPVNMAPIIRKVSYWLLMSFTPYKKPSSSPSNTCSTIIRHAFVFRLFIRAFSAIEIEFNFRMV
jgi:hypothetical protein